MPEYLTPGVYVEEISTGSKAIDGVSTDVAAFLGMTERGPASPRMTASWAEYRLWFGEWIGDQSFLPFAVQGFFQNGGRRCVVGRITPASSSFSGGVFHGLLVTAIGRGTWGNRVRFKVTVPSQPDEDSQRFRIQVIYYGEETDPGADFVDPLLVANIGNPQRVAPDVVEDFDNLTTAPGESNVVNVINSSSKLIRVWWPDGQARGSLPPSEFATLETFGNAGSDGAGRLTPDDFKGLDEAIGADLADPANLLGRGSGFVGLAQVENVSLVCVPDEVRIDYPALSRLAIEHCETMRDRFAICAIDQRRSDVASALPPQDSAYAAAHYPWIRVYDPRAGEYRFVPPSGHIAGMYARADSERGVHKAPTNEVVRGADDLEFPVTTDMQDVLNRRGVNCLRDFRAEGRGIRLWGARTMSSEPEWRYVNVRRLFVFIQASIDAGTGWVVFEPNDESTWARVRTSIADFLKRLWRGGALQGATQEEAFFVTCDRTTMTPEDVQQGRLIYEIGMAPIKPAEFVILRLTKKTAEAH